nr:hypothetical protein [Streptomyces sp. MSC1_001]
MRLDLPDGEPLVPQRYGLSSQHVRHDGTSSPYTSTRRGCVQSVLRLLGDVASPVLCESQGKIQDQAALGVLSGSDAIENLDGVALLEQVGEHDQPLQEVPAEPVNFLDGEHVAGAHVLKGCAQAGTLGDLELAGDLRSKTGQQRLSPVQG